MYGRYRAAGPSFGSWHRSVVAAVAPPSCKASSNLERERTFAEPSDTQSHFRTWHGCTGP